VSEEARDDGLTAIGLFHLADDYLRGAQSLADIASLARGPARLLGIHAIELYLKSFLRSRGHTHERLASARHELTTVVEGAKAAGLQVSEHMMDRIERIAGTRAYVTARYGIESTDRSATSAASILKLATELRGRVGSALNFDFPKL
jgi:hypothetical protein